VSTIKSSFISAVQTDTTVQDRRAGYHASDFYNPAVAVALAGRCRGCLCGHLFPLLLLTFCHCKNHILEPEKLISSPSVSASADISSELSSS
jgi:hypothetical protein